MDSFSPISNVLAQRLLPDWLTDESQALSTRLARLASRQLALGVASARTGFFLAESIPLLALQRLAGGLCLADAQR